MRTVFNHAMGWGALPFIALVGLAYGWVVSRILAREPRPKTQASVRRAA
jgi:hypothetical protein